MSTIAAIATAQASSGLGTIKISGENALTIADSVFSPDILIVPKPEDAWAVAIAAIVDKSISP